MARILASLAIAAALLATASSEASAWVCRAGGIRSTAWARSPDIVYAKMTAMHRCARRSVLPVCTILYCRPGY